MADVNGIDEERANSSGDDHDINIVHYVDEELSATVLDTFRQFALARGVRSYHLLTRPVSGIGENSYGLVLQVSVRPTDAEAARAPFVSILKVSPKSPARRAHMHVVDFYAREVYMYEKVFREFRDLHDKRAAAAQSASRNGYLAATTGVAFDVVPEMLYASLKLEDEFLIFEDLTQKQYRQNSRLKMPTYDLVREAFRAIAQLHAMSFVLQALRPHVFGALVAEMRDNLFTPNMELVSLEFGKKYVRRTRDMFAKGHDQEVRVVDTIEQHFKEICLRCVDGMAAAPYAVICHGDFWNNNILYKYNSSGKAIGAKLIDFQMSRYASPVLDLVHYLFACTEKELRDKHFAQLMDIYYATLALHLRHFQLDVQQIFPLEVFHQHLRDFGVYGFCMSAFAIPFFISNTSELPDLDAVSKAIIDLPSSPSSTATATTTTSSDNSDTESSIKCNGNGNDRTSSNDSCASQEEENKCLELLDEYDLLTERTLPIFKRRMTDIVADLVKYDMIDQLLQL